MTDWELDRLTRLISGGAVGMTCLPRAPDAQSERLG